VRGLARNGTYRYVADETSGSSRTGAVLAYDLTGEPTGSVPIADAVRLLVSAGYVYVGSGSDSQVLAFKGGAFTDPPVTVVGRGVKPSDRGPGDPGRRPPLCRQLRGPASPALFPDGPTAAGGGCLFLDPLPDQPEVIGMF
jgi:hypothetical protein